MTSHSPAQLVAQRVARGGRCNADSGSSPPEADGGSRSSPTPRVRCVLDLTPEEWTAVALSLRIALVATVVSLPFGIAVAWLLARKDFWGKALLDGIVHLPLVLPPVVTGYLLLITFGRKGAGRRVPRRHSASCSRSAGPARRSPAA